jgi:hypothetical protein
MHQVNLNPSISRGSVPPDQRIYVNMPQRAKSVSKEIASDDSPSMNLNNSSIFSPSRFFSLSRKFAKRFNNNGNNVNNLASASAPTIPKAETIVTSSNNKPLKPIAVIDDKSSKKPARERALSPSKLFRSLRPRSPFSRTRSAITKTNNIDDIKQNSEILSAPNTPLISTNTYPNSNHLNSSLMSMVNF